VSLKSLLKMVIASDPKKYCRALNFAERFDNVYSQNIPSHEEFVEYFQNLSNVADEDLLDPLTWTILDLKT
jgi:hypothetical protein